MSTLSDEKLIEQIQAEQPDAFQLLFRRYYAIACQVIRRVIPDTATVEDLAQEVFVRIWERRHQLNIQSSFSGYIRRAALNEALTFLRRKKNKRTEEIDSYDLPNTDAGTQEVLEGKELQAQINEAIEHLPPRCRQVFMLSRFEEMTYKEIAAQLDISIKTVENQMTKALRILRSLLQSHLQLLLLCGFFDNF